MSAPQHKNHAIYFVPGLQRGLEVMEILAGEGRPMSVNDIAKRLNTTRSSMFRLTYTLMHLGFIEEVPDTKLIRLGPRVLSIGFAYLASKDIIEIARPELEVLRDRTNVSAHLAILDRGDVLYLACVQTRSGFLSAMTVGVRLPAYATPMGWFLLSGQSATQLRSLYPEKTLAPLTDQTPRNIADLQRVIAATLQRGYAVSHGGVSPGGSSIAAPLRNREGAVVGAIDISAPDSAFNLAEMETTYVREVVDAAGRISALLGHDGSVQVSTAGVVSAKTASAAATN
jgi:DNA-binding IclR family transcriptional regulator